jgi:hypothetical protein
MKTGLFVKIMKYMIREFLRSSYQNAHQRFALRVILKTILDEQRYEFQEDNEVTTLSFVVEQAVRSSRVERDWPMTEKLMDIVGDPYWKEDFTNNGKNHYTPYLTYTHIP